MTAAPPVSVRRNSRSGVSSRRTQVVRSENWSEALGNLRRLAIARRIYALADLWGDILDEGPQRVWIGRCD